MMFLQNDKWHIQKAWIEYYKSRIKYDRQIIADAKLRTFILKDNWIE